MSTRAHRTDDEGHVQELLDMSKGVREGELQMTDLSADGKETVVWTIPIQAVEEPPAAALPGIEPFPLPPPASAPPSAMVDYEQQLGQYRARVLAPLKERLIELIQVWDQTQTSITTMPLPGPRTASDPELWGAWVVLCNAYAMIVGGYEAAWRLWNLADLPLDTEPKFPILSSDVPDILDALARFRRRRGILDPVPLSGVLDALDGVKEVHDGSGLLIPFFKPGKK
jgi:hypothetical protein